MSEPVLRIEVHRLPARILGTSPYSFRWTRAAGEPVRVLIADTVPDWKVPRLASLALEEVALDFLARRVERRRGAA